MRRRVLMIVILAASWVTVVPAFAADTDAKSAADAAKAAADAAKSSADTAKSAADAAKANADAVAAIANDKTKFLGDRIVFKQDTWVYLQDGVEQSDGTLKPKETLVCIPGGTYLRGIGQNSSANQLFVADCDWRQFLESFPFCKTKDVYECGFTKAKDRTENSCTRDAKCIRAGMQIRIPQAQLAADGTPPNRYGYTYGALVVPFKFELTGKKEFKGSASVAPYMGYRFGFEASGIELAFPVVFAGVSNVSATQTTTTAATATSPASSSTSTSDLAAFSYGAGLIGTLKQTFQFGAVVGFDHAGSGQGFQYNDKPWLAVEVGYQLSQ